MFNGEKRRVWAVYTEDWTRWGIPVEKADATFLLRAYEDKEKAQDYASGFSCHAVALEKTVPASYACFDAPTWRKALQYGVPEVWAMHPGTFIESVTIRHPSGATLQARHRDAVFRFQGASTLCLSDDVIDRLLAQHRLWDVGWRLDEACPPIEQVMKYS
jgi:hypothetical protein